MAYVKIETSYYLHISTTKVIKGPSINEILKYFWNIPIHVEKETWGYWRD